MKKVIVILVSVIAMLAFSINAKAQIYDAWYVTTDKGDEFLGTKDSNFYAYIASDKNTIATRALDIESIKYIMVSSGRGIFDYGTYHLVNASVGFYDANNEYITKKDISLYAGERGDTAICSDKILINYLKHSKGYIRIRISLYMGGYFDLTFPTMPMKAPIAPQDILNQ